MTAITDVMPGRAGVYARLAKLDVWDYYLALPLAWSITGPAAWFEPRVLGMLALFGIGTVFVVASTVTFDDVTGFLDGSDSANYGPKAPSRKLARKPLLTGEITVVEAVRFGWCAAAAGAVFWVLAALVAPFSLLWTIGLASLCLVTAVQYSWGLKISYRGWQEVFLAGFGIGLVLCAVGFATGTVSPFGIVQAVLFGLGPLMFGVYSNTRNARGDAAVGRRTVAALVSENGDRLFIAALTMAEIGLIVVSAGLGAAPWWFALVMLPAMVLRVAQLRRGVGLGDLVGARTLGLRAHRFTTALLIAVNLAGAGA